MTAAELVTKLQDMAIDWGGGRDQYEVVLYTPTTKVYQDLVGIKVDDDQKKIYLES